MSYGSTQGQAGLKVVKIPDFKVYHSSANIHAISYLGSSDMAHQRVSLIDLYQISFKSVKLSVCGWNDVQTLRLVLLGKLRGVEST